MPYGLPGFLRRMAASGIGEGVNQDVRRRMALVNAFCIIIFLFSAIMAVLNVFAGETRYILLVGGLAAMAAASIYLNHITRNVVLATLLILLAVNAAAVYLVATGGHGGSGHLWLFFIPTLILFSFGLRVGLISMGALIAVCALILFYPGDALAVHDYALGFGIRYLIALTGATLFSGVAEYSRKITYERLERRNGQLEKALGEIRELSGLIPICASCKKVRDDEGYWSEVEVYMRRHSDMDFSHSLCPDCAARLYPEHAGGGEDEESGD
ncbi:MAG: hypothetical protein R6U36_07840 [Candidatus Fermentibacteraceae bacterium]